MTFFPKTAGNIFNSKAGVARTMITSEQAKHYGDLAAYGIGGYAIRDQLPGTAREILLEKNF